MDGLCEGDERLLFNSNIGRTFTLLEMFCKILVINSSEIDIPATPLPSFAHQPSQFENQGALLSKVLIVFKQLPRLSYLYSLGDKGEFGVINKSGLGFFFFNPEFPPPQVCRLDFQLGRKLHGTS